MLVSTPIHGEDGVLLCKEGFPILHEYSSLFTIGAKVLQ